MVCFLYWSEKICKRRATILFGKNIQVCFLLEFTLLISSKLAECWQSWWFENYNMNDYYCKLDGKYLVYRKIFFSYCRGRLWRFMLMIKEKLHVVSFLRWFVLLVGTPFFSSFSCPSHVLKMIGYLGPLIKLPE